jgi:hypothetical protein
VICHLWLSWYFYLPFVACFIYLFENISSDIVFIIGCLWKTLKKIMVVNIFQSLLDNIDCFIIVIYGQISFIMVFSCKHFIDQDGLVKVYVPRWLCLFRASPKQKLTFYTPTMSSCIPRTPLRPCVYCNYWFTFQIKLEKRTHAILNWWMFKTWHVYVAFICFTVL